MVAVDVGVEEFHAVVQHGVPLAHGDAVDVGAHGGVQGYACFGEALVPLTQAAGVDAAVQQVGEIQVVGGKAQTAVGSQLKELLAFLFGGGFEELLHTIQSLAVPAEIPVGFVLHHAQGSADVIHLQLDHVLLQVGVTDIGVGMMHGIHRADGMLFHGESPHFMHFCPVCVYQKGPPHGRAGENVDLDNNLFDQRRR